jgi:hypothetical protein
MKGMHHSPALCWYVNWQMRQLKAQHLCTANIGSGNGAPVIGNKRIEAFVCG